VSEEDKTHEIRSRASHNVPGPGFLSNIGAIVERGQIGADCPRSQPMSYWVKASEA
jgi:hypothetical protein